MSKYIFVTGGVVSSIGKGITTSSIAMLLKKRGYRISVRKMDPYINVDSGTMSPYQHGEVYVTDDGTETDLDLGHYERFTNLSCDRFSNYTTGRIYRSVINKEREGKYLGQTVQIIPHVTDEIKSAILQNDVLKNIDITIVEIGGTVGDIESLPFLEAARQLKYEKGRENVLFIHITLIPYIKSAEETKTKPTQQSVAMLRTIGIVPDILVCRCERSLTKEQIKKISLFCSVSKAAIFEEKDVNISIYEVPIELSKQKFDILLLQMLSLSSNSINLSDWNQMLNVMFNAYKNKNQNVVAVVVIGKYIELKDAYYSVYEAIRHGGIKNNVFINIKMIESEDIDYDSVHNLLSGVNAILIPGGFGGSRIGGKLIAIRYARENKIPFFGICLGLQSAMIEFAKNVCGIVDANSMEFNNIDNSIICLLKDQQSVEHKGATMKLGSFPILLKNNSKVFNIYGNLNKIYERYRHRYTFNRDYESIFIENGISFVGFSDSTDKDTKNKSTIEIIELIDHPWYIACQFHPEFKSSPIYPHPLFISFIKAALDNKNNKSK